MRSNLLVPNVFTLCQRLNLFLEGLEVELSINGKKVDIISNRASLAFVRIRLNQHRFNKAKLIQKQ